MRTIFVISILRQEKACYVILAENVDYVAVEDIIHLFGIRLDEREDNRHITIEYKVGIAESFGGNHTARKLLAEALQNKKTFKSGDNAEKSAN